jgi:very-short-patch-repair endonuclease
MSSRYIPYRRALKPRARSLRKDSTPAERKLWYEFLSGPDSHFSERGEAYDLIRTAELKAQGLRLLRFTNAEVMQDFGAVCEAVLRALGEA